MTQKEQAVLDFIKKSTAKGNIPSIREICKNTGISSTSTVWAVLSSLEKQGHITVSREKSRGIQLANFNVSLVPLATKAMVDGTAAYVPFPANNAENIFAINAAEDIGEIKAGDTVFFSPCYAAPPKTVGAFETDGEMCVGIVGITEGALCGKMIGFTRIFDVNKTKSTKTVDK